MKCPCGLNDYQACCGQFLEVGEYGDGEVPATPEELMRSRYSAYVLKKLDFLYETCDPQTRDDYDRDATEKWANEATFTKLEILNSSEERTKGFVEFKAFYKIGDQELMHHETSRFRKSDGIWYFRDGKILNEAK